MKNYSVLHRLSFFLYSNPSILVSPQYQYKILNNFVDCFVVAFFHIFINLGPDIFRLIKIFGIKAVQLADDEFSVIFRMESNCLESSCNQFVLGLRSWRCFRVIVVEDKLRFYIFWNIENFDELFLQIEIQRAISPHGNFNQRTYAVGFCLL